MKKFKKYLLLLLFFVILAPLIAYGYYQNKINSPLNSNGEEVAFTVSPGEGVKQIAGNLAEKGLIDSKFFFETYVWQVEKEKEFKAGDYILSPSMSIREIVSIITTGESLVAEKKITIIEGWNLKDIASYLEKQDLGEKEKFYSLAGEPKVNYHKKTVDPKDFPKDYTADFPFLQSKPDYYGLEGYLFPDTYKVFADSDLSYIIYKMLNNFDRKLNSEIRQEIEKQGKSIHEIVTMASLIEEEVRTEEDMKIVSGIFWDRIKNGQSLQSCATLAYILGENKPRYSTEDTKIDSPFNTYQNKGLPPTPISNPGLKAIKAAVYPEFTDYNYFLSRPDTDETIFSKTLQEHNANKNKYLN